MSKHTPEPWFYHRQGFSTVYIEARIGGGMLQEVAACGPCQDGTEQQDENARRIVACVNACGGLPTEQLESSPTGGILNGVAGLITQRDELLAALKEMQTAYVRLLECGKDRIESLGGQCDSLDFMVSHDDSLSMVDKVIAKAKGV